VKVQDFGLVRPSAVFDDRVAAACQPFRFAVKEQFPTGGLFRFVRVLGASAAAAAAQSAGRSESHLIGGI
jgi:hypothetical protein